MDYSHQRDPHYSTGSYSDRSSLSMAGHPSNEDDFLPPHTPPTPEPSQPLLNSPLSPRSPFPTARRQGTFSSNNVSPLNPRSPPTSSSNQPSSRSASVNSQHPGNMILWKMAGHEKESMQGPNAAEMQPLQPPNFPGGSSRERLSHFSERSNSDTSLMSYGEDSKYPSHVTRPISGLVAYAYDPFLDDGGPDQEDEKKLPKHRGCNWRGFVNVACLAALMTALVSLFALYPILAFFRTNARQLLITGNVNINQTGQFPDLPGMRGLIDTDTPSSALTRTGFDGNDYELVFSDEFNLDGRTFWPGDDPYWEAVDLWYWATIDMEWYDPRQITTRDGHLVITMEEVLNHNLNWRSGMLQSWNKFCFTTGYIEVSLSLPGRNNEAQGYWPGAWIMGNLGRPGYGASTDGMWPYSYDSCDIGTYPNQTFPDKSGPPDALFTPQGRAKYNNNLSWLGGQRLSACTCPNEEHPGPVVNGKFVGRGVPEIDILEAQKNKLGDGAKVSQSLQMAPFNHDYQAGWDLLEIVDPTITARNSYNGSAVQQAVSCLTTLPERIFNGTGGEFATFGFEWWSDPSNRQSGYVTWQSDGTKTYTAPAGMLAGDPITQIGDRLMPEEPMSIILNLGMSSGFQVVNPLTLDFPAELHVDYVRVYQRKGSTNVGCDPPGRPTAKYIQDHLVAYSNPNITVWKNTNFTVPRNGAYYGSC